MAKTYLEVKRTLNGERREYACEALAVSRRLAVVRFVFSRPLTAGEITFPSGGVTLGFFWRGRHYNLYHILTPDGALIADRFDVIDHVRIHADGVRYDDLLLDLWIYADGRRVVEDEDEVEAAIAAGRLSPARQATISRTRALLLRDGARIVAAALADLARLRPA